MGIKHKPLPTRYNRYHGDGGGSSGGGGGGGDGGDGCGCGGDGGGDGVGGSGGSVGGGGGGVVVVVVVGGGGGDGDDGGGDSGHRRRLIVVAVKVAEQRNHSSSERFRAINTKNTNKIYILIIPSTTAEGASIYRPDMTIPSPHFPTTSNLRRSETETVVYGNQLFSICLERNDFNELILTEHGSICLTFFSVFTFFLINYSRLL